MTRDLAIEVRALEERAATAEADGRRDARDLALELLDDVDRGLIDLAEYRRRLEAIA